MTASADDAGLAWDVLNRFTDPGSAMFDAVLAAAGLDAETARALRFWQRESVHGVKQYAAHALPAVFLALAEAQDDVHEAAVRAERAWRRAGDSPVRTRELVVLPDSAPSPDDPALPDPDLLEQRRATVAARLAR